jgi:hypothetical protein
LVLPRVICQTITLGLLHITVFRAPLSARGMDAGDPRAFHRKSVSRPSSDASADVGIARQIGLRHLRRVHGAPHIVPEAASKCGHARDGNRNAFNLCSFARCWERGQNERTAGDQSCLCR